MENLKLIQILKTLSHPELKEFEKFVASPFFNESRKLMRLLRILRKFYPEFSSRKLNREYIFKELYPEENYNDKKLRNGFSAILKLVEKYLSYREYEKYPFWEENNLLKILNAHKLDKLFEHYLNIAEKEINSNKSSIEYYFQYSRELKKTKIDFYLRRDKQKLICDDVVKREEFGIFYFLTQFMKGYKEMLSNQFSYNFEFKNSTADEFMKCLDLEKFITYLKNSENKNYPFIALKYYLIKAMSDYKDETHIAAFRKLFYAQMDKLTKSEQLHFYLGWNDYLIISESIQSSNKSISQSFIICKEMLAKDLYLREKTGHMSLVTFNNIFFVALWLKEFTWLEIFIRDYIDKLRPEHKISMKYLCTAFLEFEKGNFEKALDNLGKVNYEHFNNKLSVKSLMLKIYYELNLNEQVYSLIDASKHFYSKNKFISDNRSEKNLRLITFLERLVKMKMNRDFSAISILKKEILDSKYFASKEWLIEKIEELEKTAKQKPRY